MEGLRWRGDLALRKLLLDKIRTIESIMAESDESRRSFLWNQYVKLVELQENLVRFEEKAEQRVNAERLAADAQAAITNPGS